MTDTVHLGLPFIEGSQAQKHVTHNEALRILDSIVHIGVLDETLAAPPPSPSEGDRYIVPAGASGAWAGQADALAVCEDGVWRFFAPRPGWCAWSAASGALLVYDGAAWSAVSGGGGSFTGSVAQLGINATATAPNLLTLQSNAALFKAITTADGGSGDMRLQISKAGGANTASVIFSDALSGRAEFGLVGSDQFKLKVSDDGVTFTEAMTFAQATGNATFARGLSLTGIIAPAQITANQNDYAPAGLAAASVVNLSADAARSLSGLAGGVEGRVVGLINTGGAVITLLNESAASSAANRFAFGGNVAVGAKQAVWLRYDGTASRWHALARPAGAGRELLTADRTYYVRTDGSNTNDGLSNTSGGAFLTIQKAVDVIAMLDIGIYDVTIQLGDGTYTAGVLVNGPWVGTGNVRLRGNVTTPANTVISTSSASCIAVQNYGRLIVGSVKLQNSGGSGDCLQATFGGAVLCEAGIVFGASARYHYECETGGIIQNFANYSIVGSAAAHAAAGPGGVMRIAINTITIAGTLTFSFFIGVSRGAVIDFFGMTFTGSYTVTGPRYQISNGGILYVNGAGANFLPGNSAGTGGTTSGGGFYG